YCLWFIALIWIHVYTFFKEPEVFRKLMYFVICTQTIAILIFVLYPSVQYLRPEVMPRDNIFTEMVSHIYAIDTNTNVCPSLHVIGGIGVWLAAMQCKALRGKAWRFFLHTGTILICISTVFLKQHSLIDIPVALVVSLIGYVTAYSKVSERLIFRRKRKAETVI
ncbi:MAG: phosphatase PAP2 family protein, partial [Ruminococcus sp.]